MTYFLLLTSQCLFCVCLKSLSAGIVGIFPSLRRNPTQGQYLKVGWWTVHSTVSEPERVSGGTCLYSQGWIHNPFCGLGRLSWQNCDNSVPIPVSQASLSMILTIKAKRKAEVGTWIIAVPILSCLIKWEISLWNRESLGGREFVDNLM